MSIAIWIMIGVITGAIASKLMPGKDIKGVSTSIIIGMIGATTGGWLGLSVSHLPLDLLSIHLGSILSSMIGAYFILVTSRIAAREYF